MDKNKVGLTLGALFGLGHLLWSLLVAVGLAQPLLDWDFSLHFLNNPFSVSGFSLTTAVILIVVTSVVGYVVGWAFAYLWEMVKKR